MRTPACAQRNLGIAEPEGSALAHIGGFSAQQEVVARRREEIDHFAVFAKPSLVLRTSRNDHDVAGAADSLFAAEAELHLSLEHPVAPQMAVSTITDTTRI